MMNDIEKIWRDFEAKPFPEGYAGVEIEGIELASLDTFAAGCIDTFVRNEGRLDAGRISILKECAAELAIVAQKLEGEAQDYFEKLHLLTVKVLRLVE
ncbi:MAG: hypothetical protein M3458_20565 [Acidobacteriota bacterium]|nr:hypothetical protein [Acidobacteriota bacterium]